MSSTRAIFGIAGIVCLTSRVQVGFVIAASAKIAAVASSHRGILARWNGDALSPPVRRTQGWMICVGDIILRMAFSMDRSLNDIGFVEDIYAYPLEKSCFRITLKRFFTMGIRSSVG